MGLLSFLKGKPKPLTLVKPPRSRDGQVDWQAVPEGAGLALRIQDEGHPLHGSRVQAVKHATHLAVRQPDGTERPFPFPQAPTSPARGLDPADAGERAAAMHAALLAAYGLDDEPEDVSAKAAAAAQQAGFSPDRAALFGQIVAEAVAEAASHRREQVLPHARAQAAKTLLDRFNQQLPAHALRGQALKKLQTALPFYRPGDGLQTRDAPVSRKVLRSLVNLPSTAPPTAAALTVAIPHNTLAHWRDLPAGELQRRVDRAILHHFHAARSLAGLPQHHPGDPRLSPDPSDLPPDPPHHDDALTLTLPAPSPRSLSPEAAEAALTLHAGHDALTRRAHPETNPVPLLSAETAVVAAADPLWQDAQQLETACTTDDVPLPDWLGAAVSAGAGLLLPGSPLPAALPPGLLAALASERGAAVDTAAVLTANRALWELFDTLPDDDLLGRAELLATLAAGTGLAYGQVLAIQPGRGQPDDRFAATTPDPRTAAAFLERLQAAGAQDAALTHDGAGMSVSLSQAALQRAALHLQTLPPPSPDDPVSWLLANDGGILSRGDAGDVGGLLADLLQRKPSGLHDRLIVLCPLGEVPALAAALRGTDLFGDVLTLADDEDIALPQLQSVRTLVVSYRQALARLGLLAAVQAWGLVLLAPPLLRWQHDVAAGAGLADLLALPSRFRVLITDLPLATAPLGLIPFVQWVQRGRPHTLTTDDGTAELVGVLPALDLWGLTQGYGAASPAADATLARLFAQLPDCYAPPSPRRIVYAEQAFPPAQAAAALTETFSTAVKQTAKPALAFGQTKQFAKLDYAARRRAVLEAAAFAESMAEGSHAPLSAACAAACGEGSRHAVVVATTDQVPSLLAALAAAGYRADGSQPAVLDATRERGRGMSPLLEEWAAGSAHVLLLAGDQIGRCDLSTIDTLHVLGAPTATAQALADVGDGDPLTVIAYRLIATPFDDGGWERLRAACGRRLTT